MSDKTTVSVRVNSEIERGIERVAEEKDLSKSDAAREVLQRGLKSDDFSDVIDAIKELQEAHERSVFDKLIDAIR